MKSNLIGHSRDYPQHKDSGQVPTGLEAFVHRLPWPILTTKQDINLACYPGEPHYSAPGWKEPHNGLDIQVREGTPVRLPETARVLYCYVEYGMAQCIFAQGIESRIVYCFAHLAAKSLPDRVKFQSWFDPDSQAIITRRQMLGRVAHWPNNLGPDVQVPEDVTTVYDRAYHHLHFDTSYLSSGKLSLVRLGDRFNPLLVLTELS